MSDTFCHFFLDADTGLFRFSNIIVIINVIIFYPCLLLLIICLTIFILSLNILSIRRKLAHDLRHQEKSDGRVSEDSFITSVKEKLLQKAKVIFSMYCYESAS